MELTNKNYVDRVASMFLANGIGATSVKITSKYAPKTDKNPEPAVLMHIEGVIPGANREDAGIIINADYWPRNNASKEELAELLTPIKDESGKVVGYDGKEVNDIILRFGYTIDVDPLTGEKTQKEGVKWIAFAPKGSADFKRLSGEQRAFHEAR